MFHSYEPVRVSHLKMFPQDFGVLCVFRLVILVDYFADEVSTLSVKPNFSFPENTS